MLEEMTEALSEERRGITGDLGGVLIETSTLATVAVGLVTISGRTGSITSVEDVGWYLQSNGCQDRQHQRNYQHLTY